MKQWKLSKLSAEKKVTGDSVGTELMSVLKNCLTVESSFVLWHDKALVFGTVKHEQNNFNWHPASNHSNNIDFSVILTDTLVRNLRIFNEAEELFIWRFGNEGGYRYRQDEDVASADSNQCVHVADAQLYMWGEVKETRETKTTIVEEGRGIQFEMPSAWRTESCNKPILITRYYFEPHPETGEAVMVDMRFKQIQIL